MRLKGNVFDNRARARVIHQTHVDPNARF